MPPHLPEQRLRLAHPLRESACPVMTRDALPRQDTIIRWKRMDGYEALWVPGTDHAGAQPK